MAGDCAPGPSPVFASPICPTMLIFLQAWRPTRRVGGQKEKKSSVVVVVAKNNAHSGRTVWRCPKVISKQKVDGASGQFPLSVSGMRCKGRGEREGDKPVFCSMSARDKIKYIPKDGQHQERESTREAEGRGRTIKCSLYRSSA